MSEKMAEKDKENGSLSALNNESTLIKRGNKNNRVTFVGRVGASAKFDEIIASLERNDPQLLHVDLWWRLIGKKGVIKFKDALSHHTYLKELDISGNGLKKDGIKLIMKGLKSNTTLTSLSAHNNDIGKEGAKSVSEFLTTNKSLIYLNIGNNGIGKEGVDYLQASLTKNSILKTLDIQCNDIKKKAAESIAKLIATNQSLTCLDVSGNDLTNAGAKIVFQALKTNETLLYLHISYNDNGRPIIRTGLKLINEILERNRAKYEAITSPSVSSAPNLLNGGSHIETQSKPKSPHQHVGTTMSTQTSHPSLASGNSPSPATPRGKKQTKKKAKTPLIKWDDKTYVFSSSQQTITNTPLNDVDEQRISKKLKDVESFIISS